MSNLSPRSDLGAHSRFGLPLPPATLAGFVIAVAAVFLIAFISLRSLES